MYCNATPFDFETTLDTKSFKTSETNDQYIIGMANHGFKSFSFCLNPKFKISKEAEKALEENGYSFFSNEDIGFGRMKFQVRRQPRRIETTVGHLVLILKREGADIPEAATLCIRAFGEDKKVALEEDYDTDYFHLCLHDGSDWWWTGAKIAPVFVGLIDDQP